MRDGASLARSRLDQFDRALARRIDQHLVETSQRASDSGIALKQVGDAEFDLAQPARWLRRFPPPLDQAGLPSTPTTLAPERAIGSVKLPKPQNMSAIRSPGCGSSKPRARRTRMRLTA